MNIYSTINDIEQAILQVGDTVRILGERTEGDIATMTGVVRAPDAVINNRIVYSKNELPIEIFPVPATEATKEFVEGEIHDFHTDAVKDIWRAGEKITSWVHKIYQEGDYYIPKTVPFITKATWESDKENWVVLESTERTLRETIITVNTVEELKKSSFTEGQLVKTRGYYVIGDKGASDYIIQQGSVKYLCDHPTANGYIAKCLHSDTGLNLHHFGAKGNAVIGEVDPTNPDNRFFSGDYDDMPIRSAIEYLKDIGGGKIIFNSLFLFETSIIPWHNITFEGLNNRTTGVLFGADKRWNSTIWIGSPFNGGVDPDPYLDQLPNTKNFKMYNMRISSSNKSAGELQPPDFRYKSWGVSGCFDGLRIEDCYFDWLAYDACDIFDRYDHGVTPCRDVKILNNVCENMGRHGYTARGCTDFEVIGNTARHVFQRGITIEQDNISSLVGKAVITGNTIDYAEYAMTLDSYPDYEGDLNYYVANNVCTNIQKSVNIDMGLSKPRQGNFVTLENNRFYCDVRLKSEQTTTLTNNLITGNIIGEVATWLVVQGNTIGGYLQNNYSKQLSILDNKFTRDSSKEIWGVIIAGSTNDSVDIKRNTFECKNGVYTYGLIYVDGVNLLPVNIEANNFTGSTVDKTQPTVYGSAIVKDNNGFVYDQSLFSNVVVPYSYRKGFTVAAGASAEIDSSIFPVQGIYTLHCANYINSSVIYNGKASLFKGDNVLSLSLATVDDATKISISHTGTTIKISNLTEYETYIVVHITNDL